MASWFDAEALSLAETIEEFGEEFTFTPFTAKRINFAPSPDPSRPTFDVRAIFERDAKSVSLGMEETNVSTRQVVVTGLACELGDARQGDRLTHKLTGETFEVTDPRPDGLSGIALRLVQLGRQRA